MRALILDGEEFAPGVTDQNVVAGYLKRPAAAVGNVCNISQFSKIAVIQMFCLPQVWNGYRNIGLLLPARYFVPSDAVIIFATDFPEIER